jgi:RNA polymerase sigma-70 factor (ECF subfamily)
MGPGGVRDSDLLQLDEESAQWLASLGTTGPPYDDAVRRLHELLLRIARSEIRRRSGSSPITGPELDDLAYQAAADAMVAITKKLSTFRGASRFTSWAYKFVILEVGSKLTRHFWHQPRLTLAADEWDRLPDRLGMDPARAAVSRELVAEIRRTVETEFTERQRRIFLALIVRGVPLDVLVVELDSNRNAIYKTMFDARRKLRARLVATGYITDSRQP